jgi:hypothetical protein
MDEKRAGRLQALKQHPSWPELSQAVDEYREAYANYLTKSLLATGDVPEDLEYKRGFLAGMKYVTRYPGIAEKTLERAIAKSREEGVALVG